MIKCVTKIKNKTNKNNKQNGKRKIKTKITFVSSIFFAKIKSHEKQNQNQTERKCSLKLWPVLNKMLVINAATVWARIFFFCIRLTFSGSKNDSIYILSLVFSFHLFDLVIRIYVKFMNFDCYIMRCASAKHTFVLTNHRFFHECIYSDEF